MDKTIILIMGRSGSGKSTLEHNLVHRYPEQFKKIVGVTTREQREGEEDGIHYNFINETQYQVLELTGQLVQKTSFAGNHYGTMEEEYTTHHPYAVLALVPSSAAYLIEQANKRFPSFKIKVIYFDISEERLSKNMSERGDSIHEIRERLSIDDLDEQFEQSGLQADIIITNDMLDEHLHEYVYNILENNECLHTTTSDT